MSSRNDRWYLLFLWSETQIRNLLNLVATNNFNNIVVIHPIFDIVKSRNRISIRNIVSLAYLRGFAYTDQNGILYTGIGCHKIPGIFIALNTGNVEDNLNTIFQSYPRVATVYDISLDFFSTEKIDIRNLDNVLNRIDTSLRIERRPVITTVGQLSCVDLYTLEVRYENYENILEEFTRIINDFISYEQNDKYSIKRIIGELDQQKKEKIYLIGMISQDNRKRLDSINLGEINTVEATPSIDDLRSAIRRMFVITPKRIRL